VAGLGHGEAADEIEVDEVADVRVVVVLGAEVLDRAPEQAPLHTRLDHERQVELRQHLDRRDRHARVAAPTVLLAEAGRRHAGGHQLLELAERAFARLVETEVVVEEEIHLRQLDPRLLTHVAPLAVEGDPQLV
jgi:hypothetical protein